MEEQSKTECVTGIYTLTHIASGIPYVGLTGTKIGFEGRWNGHRKKLRKNAHSPKLQNYWNKYGEDAFSFSVHTYIPQGNMSTIEFRKFLESEEVRILKLYPQNLNGTEAGNGGMTHLPEVRKKIRDANLAKMKNPEWKAAKIAAINSPESKAKKAKIMGSERIRNLKSINAKKHMQNSEFRAKQIATMHTPEVQAKATAARQKLWDDPEWSKKMKAILRASWQTPEANEKKRIATQAQWNSPEGRAKRMEVNKRAGATRRARNEAKKIGAGVEV